MTFPDPPALRAPAAILCLLVVTACGDGGGDDGATPTVISPLGGDAPPTSDDTMAPVTPSAPDDEPAPDASEGPDITPTGPDDTAEPDASPADPDDTVDPDASPTDPDVIEPSVPDDAAPAPLALDGEWLLACRERDLGVSDGVHAVTTLTIVGDTATLRERSYAEDTCSVPTAPFEFVADVAIVFPGGTIDTSRGEATNVNLTVRGLTVDGVEPGEVELGVLEAIGFFDTAYDVALIDGAELYFGDIDSDPARDGGTPERRPDRLDQLPFVRQ